MFNPALDFEKLSLEYQEKRRIVIPDFLTEETAEQIYEGFQDITARNLWYQTNFGNPNFYDKSMDNFNRLKTQFSYKFEKYPVKNTKLESLIMVDSRRHDVAKLMSITDRPELELDNSHPFRMIGDLLNNDEAHEIITKVTGKQLTKNSTACFASRYTAGNFLATHTDGGEPRMVAFVLNMTKHWLIHWGGNLVIFDPKVEKIIEAYTPNFNSLILFDVPLPHAVLPVSMYCQSERLALSGWYFKHSLPTFLPKF